jgi:bifunctional non-homologous end joining protein LigD
VTPGRAGDPLKNYRSKRDFARTPEPAGVGKRAASAGTAGAPRFVIHEHSARRMHWDLRLERDGVLVSWAIPKGMPEEQKVNHIAPHTEDHPLSYLDFEGEIPPGSYGAGTMRVWDAGTYECLKWEPRKVEVALHGWRLDARYALFAIGAGENPREWMIHRMDPPADGEREPMPARIVPMLARAGLLPRDQEQWGFEIKWDGVRAIAYCEPGSLRLESRNLREITAAYPELVRLGRALGSRRAVLDGEIVAFDADGRPSFSALAQRMHVSSPVRAKQLAQSVPVTYVIFDLLWLDAHSLTDRPYHERRQALVALGLRGERWQTPEHIVGRGRETLEASEQAGLEGIVAKRLDSPYEPGRRSGAWIKLKNISREQPAIGGWLPGTGRRRERIGALLLGTPAEDGSLRYCGRVGSGFSEAELERLARALGPLEVAASPFSPDGPPPPRGAVFCEPRLRARVAFRERTPGGMLRQPVYEGLADDRAERPPRRGSAAKGSAAGAGAPSAAASARTRRTAAVDAGAEPRLVLEGRGVKQVHAEVEGRELVLSNLDKVLYPAAGFTKRDVIDYYAALAPVLLAHLQARPLTVTRYPDGVDGKAFFQKQSPAHRPAWVRTVSVPSERRKQIDFTLADDLPTLIWLANLAALELHVPLARAPHLGRPTAVAFDLDPGAPAGVMECCHVALWLQGMFERLGLASFVKTSGSKGLQVYLPLNGEAGYEQTKTFAREVAQLVEQAEPDLALSRMTKALRAGKVLIDWSQNDEHKTTVCVYSLRARELPTVSTPLEWDELRAALRKPHAGALAFDVASARRRVRERGDLFAPMLSLVQALPAI